MGEEADIIPASTNATEEEKKVYTKVCQKFDNSLIVRRNIMFVRAGLNRRCQLEGEMATNYIMELYHQLFPKDCN